MSVRVRSIFALLFCSVRIYISSAETKGIIGNACSSKKDVQLLFIQLEDCLSKPHAKEHALTREHATLLIAQKFCEYATSDSLNSSTQAIAGSIASWLRRKHVLPEDIQSAKNLAVNEWNETKEILESAVDSCLSLRNSTSDRFKERPNAHGYKFDKKGYLISEVDNKPYVSLAYNQFHPTQSTVWNGMTRDAVLNGFGISTTAVSLSAKTLLGSSRNVSKAALQELVTSVEYLYSEFGMTTTLIFNNGREVIFTNCLISSIIRYDTHLTNYLQFFVLQANRASNGSSAFPEWAEGAYPGLTTKVGKTTFFNYDIDNPGAKEIWDTVLSAVVPALSNSSAIISWNLANEPGFVQANSLYTFAKFSAYLEKEYAGNLSGLRTAWKAAEIQSFTDDRLKEGMGQKWFSDLQYLDWAIFNQQRVSEWFEWVCGTIKHHDQGARCHIKTSNGVTPLLFRHGSGIDRVRLATSLDIAGCDTRNFFFGSPAALNKGQMDTHTPFPQYPGIHTYAMDWINMAGAYDFMRSMGNPSTPVFDTEWHPFSTVKYRDPALPVSYVKASVWLAVLHGLTYAQVIRIIFSACL